ncbi:MAG TPA: aminomethyltransferase family protein [Nitrospirota bacterium]|nr:aminomethyltransferase family protein [Nitrospirota bacterium]
MKQSPLYEAHKSLGARFTEMQGWEVPEHYGDPVSEHLAVRSSAGIMDMTQRGKILISGKDRAKFLQNILSQDINKLTPGTGGNATLLNTKGHMLAYMRIYSEEDSFLIDTEPGETDKIIEILNRYLFREDVKIEDVTLKYGLVTVQGPRSREIVCRLSGTDIKDLEECNHLNLTINNINCKIARTTYSGEEGYNIYAPWDDIKAVFSSEINPFGLAAYNSLRIEAGIPLYSIDMDEDTIPIEANLDHAISYTKGCYVGQETIARIKFKGHVNRTLTGFSIQLGTEFNFVPEKTAVPKTRIIPQKGDRIFIIIEGTEQNIGVITSACFSPTLKGSVALGYLRIEHNKPGTEVYIHSKSHTIHAVVACIPFNIRKQAVL